MLLGVCSTGLLTVRALHPLCQHPMCCFMDISRGNPGGCCVLKCLVLGCNVLAIFAEEESQLLVLLGGSLFIWDFERENSFIK